MSKKKQPQAVAANDLTKKKALVVIIVCVIMALVIAASLIIALWETAEKTVADLNNKTLDRSTSTISNGDFEYLSETQTSYPKVAQDWIKYTHKKPTSATSHGYTKINASNSTYMGVVDTNLWDDVNADLTQQGLTIANPGVRNDSDGSNVYMIHNKQATTASIYSSSFSIAATTSVKVTLWVKTVGVSDTGAFVMLKQQSASALEKSSSGVQYWYAHKGVVDGDDGIDTNGSWQQIILHVFNRTSTSRTVYLNIGLGNVYTGETATGTLFVDDIEFEKVTSNEYRELVSNANPNADDHTSYVIESESTENKVEYLSSWTDNSINASFNSIKGNDYVSNYEYMPAFEFVTDKTVANNSYIHSLSNLTKVNGKIAATSENLTIKTPNNSGTGTQYLVSLWVRVVREKINGKYEDVLPVANVYLRNVSEDTDLSSFTYIATSTDLEKDTNNGWAKYNFYIKPSDAKNIDVNVVVTFGDRGGYANEDAIPKGTVYFTDLIVEEITQSQFASAASGTYVKTYSLNGTVSSATVANNSFSNYVTNSAFTGLKYPTDWTPVFAGANEIYREGGDGANGGITVDSSYNAVESGILSGGAQGPVSDNVRQGILQITNKVATSFGYLSSNFTLSAKTVYVISILVKTTGSAVPAIYLFDNDENKILASYTANEITQFNSANGIDSAKYFVDSEPDVNEGAQGSQGGWKKFFFVIATGDTAVSAKLALFNGLIDATKTSGTSQGTVYFDRINVDTAGTYTRDKEANNGLWQKDDEDELKKDANDEYILNNEAVLKVTDTLTSGYGKVGITKIYETFTELIEKLEADGKANIKLIDNRFTDIADPVITEDPVEETPKESNVDWALLVSIISSSVLLAALIIVIFFKFVFKRQRFAR